MKTLTKITKTIETVFTSIVYGIVVIFLTEWQPMFAVFAAISFISGRNILSLKENAELALIMGVVGALFFNLIARLF